MKIEISHFKNKRILITGGLGFIGSNLALRLHDLGAKIVIIDALIPEHGGCFFNINPIEKFVKIHTSRLGENQSLLGNIISEQDLIFNLAGQSNHWYSMENPLNDLENNCVSNLSILESVRKFNHTAKIIYTSTRQIYGKPEYLPVDELHQIKPIDINGIHKAAAEQYHLLYHKVYGLKTVSLRLTNTYGPRMRIKDANQTFLGYWIRCAVEKKKFVVWGGSQIRDFNYIDDVVEALMLCAINDNAIGKTYNLGNSEFISLLELAKMVSEITKTGFDINEFPEDRKIIDIGDYYSDYSLINKELGWTPKNRLKTGLEKTLSYFQDHLDQYIETCAKNYEN
jgi:UDP-glucose 4-epimerase